MITIYPQAQTATAGLTAVTCFAAYFAKLNELITLVEITGADGQEFTADLAVQKACEILLSAQAAGCKAMIIGNGGSSAIASHGTLDLWHSTKIPALTFTDASQLTCLSNDYGYENAFAKAVEMFAQPGDVLIAISSSGKSENILNAVAAARHKRCTVITYSGFSRTAPLRSAGDLNFYIDSNEYGWVEVAHMALIHHLTDVLGQAQTRSAK